MKIDPLENQIEQQILDYLKAKGIFAWKNPRAGYYDAKIRRFRKHTSKHAINGVSDIIAVHQGKAIFIEVKKKGGVVSDDQKRFIENAQNSGGIAFVARSVEDVYRYLKDNLIIT